MGESIPQQPPSRSVVRRIYWTSHALERVAQRGLTSEEVEEVVRRDMPFER
jgi:hypothetical protein